MKIEDRMHQWRQDRARRASRAAPKPTWYNTAPAGTCRWCGKGPILNADGSANSRRTWHQDCVTDYFVCSGRGDVLTPVAEKTGRKCAGCGVGIWGAHQTEPSLIDPEACPDRKRWMLNEYMPRLDAYRYGRSFGSWSPVPSGPFSPVWRQFHDDWFGGWSGWFSRVSFCWRADVQIDHIVPLWSLDRSIPWERLIEFWRMPNLQALCGDCHKAKTSREAAERARLRRTARQPSLLPIARAA